MLGTMATVLTATIVNVALPDIMLHFSVAQGQAHWVVTGFLAAMTATMLTTGWLIDHWGVRRTLPLAMTLFTVASIGGGFSGSLGWLILSRILQGAAAGVMQPLAMYVVFRVFPREERGRAMGIYGVGVILAPALGPVLGGFIVDNWSWRYVFFAPAPVTLAGIFMALRYLPGRPEGRPAYHFDAWGFLALAGFLALSLDALNLLQHGTAELARTLTEGLGATALLWAFVRRQRRVSHPLIKLHLFRNSAFRRTCWGGLVLGLSLFGSTYLIPLFAQTALAFSATDAGLLMLPAGVALGILFPISGRWADRSSNRALVVAGLVTFSLSAACFALAPAQTGFLALAGFAVLGRIGLALLMPALSTAALNPLNEVDLGHGSSTLNFARQIGGAFGVNLLAILIEYGPTNPVGQPALQAYHAAWWLIAVCGLVAVVPIWRMRHGESEVGARASDAG
ncbi:MDR family MFS transporter [Marinobacteraceae bacterium S3BR75-40.1]